MPSAVMEVPVAQADQSGRAASVSSSDSSLGIQLKHFRFPSISMHNLKQKMKQQMKRSKKFRKEIYIFNPDTDIRETKLAYHIEMALAGLEDKDRLVIQWMSPRTLVVQGELERPFIGFGKGAQGESQWEGRDSEGWAAEARKAPENGEVLQAQPVVDDQDLPTFVLCERKVGLFQRSFTLPKGVDMQGLKARLVDGLLCIDVPKRSSPVVNLTCRLSR